MGTSYEQTSVTEINLSHSFHHVTLSFSKQTKLGTNATRKLTVEELIIVGPR